MQNRRKFLAQTTLAAGSLVFLKPLKTVAFSPANSFSSAEKLTILHLNTLRNEFQKALVQSAPGRLPGLFKNKNDNTLLLSTGNVIGLNSVSKAQHIENLTWLKKAGCDALVPSSSDLQNGAPYYEELANECNVTTLTGGTHQIANGNILPYHITLKGKIKIGVIGNVDSLLPAKCDAEKIASRLNETAAFLKKIHGCHIVISMNPCNTNSNTAYKNQEKEIAALTTNIDVMVSSNCQHKNPITFVMKNASRNEIILNYQGVESSHVKGIDISFNSKNEKVNLTLRRIV